MKKYILIFSAVLLLMPFLAFAVTAVESSGITLEDLEVTDPGILPTSNFYFLKSFVRGVQRAVTFNAVGRAELELKIVNEKAAELKKVSENNVGDEGLEKAIANYKENTERLKSRFEALKETSENPKIEERVKNDEVKIKLSEVKNELVKKFDERVNNRLIAPSAVPQLLETLPVTEAQKLRILEQVKKRTESGEVKVQLENIEGKVRAGVKD